LQKVSHYLAFSLNLVPLFSNGKENTLVMVLLIPAVIDRANMYHTEPPVCVPGMIG